MLQIDKQVDKYVADRKIQIRKVNYMPDNMYTVKRDKDGKVTGTGDQIRIVKAQEQLKECLKQVRELLSSQDSVNIQK